MQKNDELILKITDITTEGSGVGKYEGMAIFVPLTAVGDTARIKILKVKKTYAYGKMLEILEPSPDRIVPDCEAFNKCGGCVFRHIDYCAELNLKSNKVYETVKRLGGVDMKPQPILHASNFDRYRNKAQYPVGQDGKAGFYAFHSHRIIPCADCKLQPEIFKDITAFCENWMKENNISIYDETCHKGLLRHIYIRIAEKTDEIMLTLVINGDTLPYSDKLISSLTEAFKNIKSIQLNINKADTNVILGDKCITLWGNDYITDILCGVKVRLSALSFYQVNRTMAEKLYEKACEYAAPDNKNVLDLYCGAGTIGLSMAKKAKSVIGVEIIPEAVEDAKFNAKENIQADVVVVDPPRKGLTPELIETISTKFAPERVVYVSCDPATFARDIKIFDSYGYKLIEYTPADLFPRTAHCECVAIIKRT